MDSVFTYAVADKTYYADALKVRRILLSHTDGRAWTYVRDIATIKEDIDSLNADANIDKEVKEAKLGLARMAVSRLEGILAEAAVTAFEWTPFDPATGDGCTELTALTVLSEYMEFAAGKG